MADSSAAQAALTGFVDRTEEVRGAAILGPDGILAASGAAPLWDEAGRALLDAADRASAGAATHAHVATEEGEVFAVREGTLEMVAVASRFALASLVFADMRAALRDARAGVFESAAREAA